MYDTLLWLDLSSFVPPCVTLGLTQPLLHEVCARSYEPLQPPHALHVLHACQSPSLHVELLERVRTRTSDLHFAPFGRTTSYRVMLCLSVRDLVPLSVADGFVHPLRHVLYVLSVPLLVATARRAQSARRAAGGSAG